jgi:septum formation protein
MVFMIRKIVLASQSPRRKQLLEWAEVDFDVLTQVTDESWPEGMPVEEIPIHIAREKARSVMQLDLYNRYEQGVPVLAADTIVVLGNEILGKPRDAEHALTMLKALSGQKHKVITGVVIVNHEKEIRFSDVTEVDFHSIPEDDLRYYVEKFEPFDKAGAYAIQEWIGVVGIKAITGDFYNVMGLPVSRVIRTLHEEF